MYISVNTEDKWGYSVIYNGFAFYSLKGSNRHFIYNYTTYNVKTSMDAYITIYYIYYNYNKTKKETIKPKNEKMNSDM